METILIYLEKPSITSPYRKVEKRDNEYIDVETPKLAISLSGTPGQALRFIPNKVDGTLTRFTTMSFDNNDGWQAVGPFATRINLTDYFGNLSMEYRKLWEFTSQERLYVTLSAEQWKYLDVYCKEKYKIISTYHNVDATSINKRHGLMLFKVCVMLTSMRKYEDQKLLSTMICRDDDFNTALYLINQSVYASLKVYESLPAVKSLNIRNDQSRLYTALSARFCRAEGIALAKELEIAERTAGRYLQEFIAKGLLSQPKTGWYIKPVQASP